MIGSVSLVSYSTKDNGLVVNKYSNNYALPWSLEVSRGLPWHRVAKDVID